MNDVFVVLVASYIIISEVVAIINLVKLFQVLNDKTMKKYPILYYDELQTRIIMFATLIWLPCIIVSLLRIMIKE